MKLAQKIALWADQLRHLSARGLRFSKNFYDRQNYEKIQEMSAEMMALATSRALPPPTACGKATHTPPTTPEFESYASRPTPLLLPLSLNKMQAPRHMFIA